MEATCAICMYTKERAHRLNNQFLMQRELQVLPTSTSELVECVRQLRRRRQQPEFFCLLFNLLLLFISRTLTSHFNVG